MLSDYPVMILLPAVDISRAEAFYAEKLKLSRADIPITGNVVAFKTGEVTVLYIYERDSGTKAEHPVAAWHVEDIEKVVSELSERGVTFEHEVRDLQGLAPNELGIFEVNGEKIAYFKDSEGNLLSLAEPS